MGANTKIEWTETTWNPLAGCSVVSPGCTNCYAMQMAHRIKRMTEGRTGNPADTPYFGTTRIMNGKAIWTGEVHLVDGALTAPLRWKRPRRIFVNSMSDLFHESVPDEWIDRVFAVMAMCPQHTFQVLTKRSDRMRAYVDGMWDRREALGGLMSSVGGDERQGWYAPECDGKRGWVGMHLPLPNVWLGVSAEDQRRANERVPDLREAPAAVRFISAEPLLGAIDFEPWLDRIDWIIVGGESGPGARPMHPDWARSIRDQCAAAGTAFFFKQWGAWVPHRPWTADTITVWPDGSVGAGNANENGGGGCDMLKVAKKAAGRLLDGREHNAMPEVR
ncbi:Bacteriophage protein gp37 [Chelatococcus sambhunathii]|uniref:Bacteriophage protein gp37 n=1 Tax=Chelatococcus sambhunathii TaxID=363953 RepID=A0ABM9U9E2_9HYPH|nr:phage Gp37/Gp68 family protein [Chelatococcus sambhunathii]CUA90885.1 Bacteriophage protein gp37 [Chelatococcus sambhunathii]